MRVSARKTTQMTLEFSWILVAFMGIFLTAGTIKGALGVGLPTTAVSLMSIIVEPRLAVVLVVFPIFFANAWQIYRQGDIARILKTYWVYAIVVVISLWLSTQYAPSISPNAVSLIMGLAVLGFATVSYISHIPAIPKRLERPTQAVVGLLSGAMGGIAAVWAPPVVIYMLAKNFDREEFVRVSGFLLGVGGFPLLAGYLTNGLMPQPLPLISALMILPTLAGFALGEQLRKLLSGPRFRQALLIFFFVMGINMVRKGLGF